MNPLMQDTSHTIGVNSQLAQAAQSVKRMMEMLNATKNPQTAIMQAAQQNQQLGTVMQMCQGRNPQEVFVEQCKQHGMDPDETMRQIQQMLSR